MAEVERDGARPERSVYEISDAGRASAHSWLTDMLSVPRRGFPDVNAAQAHASVLAPGELATLLRTRRGAVAAEVEQLQGELNAGAAFLPRVILLDAELMVRTRTAELDYLDDALTGLDSGDIAWSRASLAEPATEHEPRP